MRIFLIILLFSAIGCGPRPQVVRFHYKEDGRFYKMRLEERDQYEAIKADIKRQYDQMISAGEEEAVALTKICESFDQRMMGLQDEPHPALISARTLMERDRTRICQKAETAQYRLNAKQRREQEAAERQRQYEERRKEREAEQPEAPPKELIQNHNGVQIRITEAADMGKRIGIGDESIGTYVLVWMEIENTNAKPAGVNSEDFWLVDKERKVYDVDTKAASRYVATPDGQGYRTPQHMKLRPGEKELVVLVFDVPVGEYDMLEVSLVFKDDSAALPLDLYADYEVVDGGRYR